MRAALCKSYDEPVQIEVEDVPVPVAGTGEVVVRVGAAALNFFDTLIVRNKYQFKPELPFSPAAEVAGVIESLGPGVIGFTPGQRVLAYIGWGGAREKIVAPAQALVPLPDGVSDAVAAGLSVTYGTALHGLKDRGRLRAGETLAVLGASGGAGLAAVEAGALLGARVIAVASSEDKLAVCKAHGATEGINYSTTDVKEALKALTNGKGVDVVYDCVGGSHAELALRAMAWGGRFLVVGFAAGEIPRIPLNLVLLKGISLVGVFWGEAQRRDPAGHRANIAEVLGWIAAGKLAPHVHGTYPLAEINAALKVIEQRQAIGKVIIVP